MFSNFIVFVVLVAFVCVEYYLVLNDPDKMEEIKNLTKMFEISDDKSLDEFVRMMMKFVSVIELSILYILYLLIYWICS